MNASRQGENLRSGSVGKKKGWQGSQGLLLDWGGVLFFNVGFLFFGEFYRSRVFEFSIFATKFWGKKNLLIFQSIHPPRPRRDKQYKNGW